MTMTTLVKCSNANPFYHFSLHNASKIIDSFFNNSSKKSSTAYYALAKSSKLVIASFQKGVAFFVKTYD